MQMLHCLIIILMNTRSSTATEERAGVEPRQLDKLLKAGKYEDVSDLLGLQSPELLDPAFRVNDDAHHRYDFLFTDMIIDYSQINEDRSKVNNSKILDEDSPFNGSAVVKWPGSIPYVISKEFNMTSQILIHHAAYMWNTENKNCIKWLPRTQQTDYVVFLPGNGCHSAVGKTGRQQPILLQPSSYCFRMGSILHEMMHTVGFAHEHIRKDRDAYIRVIFENIPEDWRIFFAKNEGEQFGDKLGYDYYSLSHYKNTFPGSDKPTFEVLQQGVNTSLIGQRNDFSELDKKKISNEYC